MGSRDWAHTRTKYLYLLGSLKLLFLSPSISKYSPELLTMFSNVTSQWCQPLSSLPLTLILSGMSPLDMKTQGEDHRDVWTLGFAIYHLWGPGSMSSSKWQVLPRKKRLLISWLQSPSAVILEPPKIKCVSFYCFPIYLPWSDGTRCHDLSFLNVEF